MKRHKQETRKQAAGQPKEDYISVPALDTLIHVPSDLQACFPPHVRYMLVTRAFAEGGKNPPVVVKRI